MESGTKIAKVINNRTCCIITKGRSVEKLESRIEEFRNKNICWVVHNRYDYIENFILKKINEHVDLVCDCATVKHLDTFEPYRIKRFKDFLFRKENNLLLTSHIVTEHCFKYFGGSHLLQRYKNKIVIIEELFKEMNASKEIWEPPPGSICLIFAFLITGGAKKIIIFGMDGCKQGALEVETYYKPEIQRVDRMRAFNDITHGSVQSDCTQFNKDFEKLLKEYKKIFKNEDVEILNCSPDSYIDAIEIINYDEVLDRI